MKKSIFKFGVLFAAMVAAASLTGCHGDDGEPGPAGTNGTNGTNGLDGVGFEEGVSRGKIVVELDGQRPDGADFTQTIEFPYAPTNLEYSRLTRYDEGTNDDNYVQLARFQGYDGLSGGGNVRYFWSETYSWLNEGNDVYNIDFDDMAIYASVSFPDEKKYFNLNAYFDFGRYLDESGEPYYEGNVTEPNIVSYTTTPGADGKFGYKLTGTIPADNNSSGYDLHVTITADVLVYENIGGESEGPSRSASPKRTGKVSSSAKKVAKAEMLPM